jgi:hypothetical protein
LLEASVFEAGHLLAHLRLRIDRDDFIDCFLKGLKIFVSKEDIQLVSEGFLLGFSFEFLFGDVGID